MILVSCWEYSPLSAIQRYEYALDIVRQMMYSSDNGIIYSASINFGKAPYKHQL